MVFQAYIDDSEDRNVLVLAGYIAPFEAWTAFADDWDKLLRNFGASAGPFKMRRMAQTDEGLRRAELFYRVIERHVTAAVSCTVDKEDLVKVIREAPRPLNVFDIDRLENPYYAAFNGIITNLPSHQEGIGISEPVDFVFDDQTEKINLVGAWELMRASANPSTRSFMGANPRFENDEDFLPLQAADLFAWWVRRWESEGCFDMPGNIPRFPWPETRRMHHLHIRYREHELREELGAMFSERMLFLRRQFSDVLRQIDQGRLSKEVPSEGPVRKSFRSRWRELLARLR